MKNCSLPGALVSLLLGLSGAGPAMADEPLFGFLYTTDLLPKGQKEIEQWLTERRVKANGKFDLVEGRTEFEYGVTDAFQLAFYANYAWTEAYRNGVDSQTTPPETFAGHSVDPNGRLSASKFVGYSLEGIYRVLSPYTDPVGLAFYLEPTIGHDLRELEERIILQKNFFDDRLVLAANVTVEQELRRLPGDPTADPGTTDAGAHWDRETDVNFGIAASYRVMPNWAIGLEFLNEREFSSFQFWKPKYATNSAYDLGPTLHYGGERFFVNLTFLAQLPWAADYANPPPGFVFQGRSAADDFEKYRFRLKAGFYF
jgi:hypothetical protein